MTTEDYVSFETAKLLKEKGFDEATYHYYNTTGARWFESVLVRHNSQGGIACPTLQMAMKWLREVHGIDISIDLRFRSEDEDVYIKSWRYTVYHTDEIEDFGDSDTYEEACEAAIKYVLENLI